MTINITNDIYFALAKVYLKALQERTPVASSLTSQMWDLDIVDDNTFKFSNPRGDIVLFLEEGTKPHIITPKNKKSLRWKKGNKEFFAKKVNHPGTEALHFVSSIFNDDSLAKKFEEVLWARVEKKIEAAIK